jgi:hypothetical protein
MPHIVQVFFTYLDAALLSDSFDQHESYYHSYEEMQVRVSTATVIIYVLAGRGLVPN